MEFKNEVIVFLPGSPYTITRVGTLEFVRANGYAEVRLSNCLTVAESGKWVRVPEGYKPNTFTDGGALGVNGPLMVQIDK